MYVYIYIYIHMSEKYIGKAAQEALDGLSDVFFP